MEASRDSPRLRIGPYTVDPPVVLAPMAGITNVAFRRLCREYGAGLYVCEMITARALLIGDPKTTHMMSFDPTESPRSVQLYGVDPATMREAVRVIVGEGLADHIDTNWGCPVTSLTTRSSGTVASSTRLTPAWFSRQHFITANGNNRQIM